jgi:hypothetical protein
LTGQVINAIVKDQFGNPVADGTSIFWGIVDNPPDGFKEAGIDGQTTAGSSVFTSSTAQFIDRQVEIGDNLIILEGPDEGGYAVSNLTQTTLTLETALSATSDGLEYVVGDAVRARICGTESSQEPTRTGNNIPTRTCESGAEGAKKGVAHSIVLYGETAVGKPYYVFAITTDSSVGEARALGYAAVAPLQIELALTPDTVASGQSTAAVGHFFDGADEPNDISDAVISFQTANSLVSGWGSVGTQITTGTTDQGGFAVASPDLVTQSCLAEDVEVTIAARSGSVVASQTLTIQATAPTAGFEWNAGSEGTFQVFFTDTTTAIAGTSIVSYSWDFGDGSTSSLQNPSHTYADDNVRAVTLTVTASNGCTSSFTDGTVTPPSAPSS